MSDKDPLGIVGATVAERYWIERFVAEGGFAVIYRAIHTVLNKRSPSSCSAGCRSPPGSFAQAGRAFVNEMALLTELSAQTAAIVQCRDIGALVTPRGEWMPYLVLEWVDGVALDVILDAEHAAVSAALADRGSSPVPFTGGERLDAVDPHGVAHRNLNSASLLVVGGNAHAPDATVKILDFGVAKMMLDNKSVKSALGATGKTVTAFTPSYGAPEQFSAVTGQPDPGPIVRAGVDCHRDAARPRADAGQGRGRAFGGRLRSEAAADTAHARRRSDRRGRGGICQSAVGASRESLCACRRVLVGSSRRDQRVTRAARLEPVAREPICVRPRVLHFHSPA